VDGSQQTFNRKTSPLLRLKGKTSGAKVDDSYARAFQSMEKQGASSAHRRIRPDIQFEPEITPASTVGENARSDGERIATSSHLRWFP